MFFFTNAALSNTQPSFWERITAWYRESVFHELLVYIQERYFTLHFDVYENFSVAAEAGTTLRNMILAIAAGIIIASIMTARTRTGLGAFVRKLLKEECNTPEKAKTLMELGYFRNSMIRRELTHGVNLRKVVRCVTENAQPQSNEANDAEKEGREADETRSAEGKTPADSTEKTHNVLQNQPDRIDFLTARFYIPEDLRYHAEFRYRKKGSDWGSVVLTVILSVVLAGALCLFLPDILTLADNIISMMSP